MTTDGRDRRQRRRAGDPDDTRADAAQQEQAQRAPVLGGCLDCGRPLPAGLSVCDACLRLRALAIGRAYYGAA